MVQGEDTTRLTTHMIIIKFAFQEISETALYRLPSS